MSTPENSTVSNEDGIDANAPIRYSDYKLDDYIALGVFWLLAIDVFVQFFSRYALNDSIGWTEEVARYLLILTTFIGGAIGVRKNTHIMVEFFYRYLGPGSARALSTVVDVIRVAFFFALSLMCYKVAIRTQQMMASIDIRKEYIYYAVAAGLFWMGCRSVMVALRHWRQGGSVLTNFFKDIER